MVSPLPTGAEAPNSASPLPSPTLSTGANGMPISTPTQTSSLPAVVSNDGSVKVTGLPLEIIGMISEEIDSYADFHNFADAHIRFHNGSRWAFAKRIRNITIFPREDQMRHILEAVQDPEVAKYVRKITLLAEGMREHEYGYVWAWEDLQIWMDLDYNPNDIRVINQINANHANARDIQSAFIYSGQYRELLSAIIKACPNLDRINVRKLAPGEQIPGWGAKNLFKQLSFFHDELDTRHIFYGDWQYDTLLGRVTQYRDEFGDFITEAGAGPQASFIDDFKAAKLDSGCKAKVVFHRR